LLKVLTSVGAIQAVNKSDTTTIAAKKNFFIFTSLLFTYIFD